MLLLPWVAKADDIYGIAYKYIGDGKVAAEVAGEWNEEMTEYIYHYPKGDITIPAEVTIDGATYKVAAVNLRESTELTNVTLPNTIEKIYDYGFYGCTQLSSINLPSSLQEIGAMAFYRCRSLKGITIPASVKEVGDAAFFSCAALKNVYLPDLPTWCNINFGGAAFYGVPHIFADNVELQDLVIPEQVTTIKPHAFENFSSLSSVYIPATVDSIGTDAFKGCTGIKKVTTEDIASWCNIRFGLTVIYQNTIINQTNPTSLSHNLYVGDQEVTELVIPEGVERIGEGAFFGCQNLKKVRFPSTLKRIGGEAFEGCNIKEVDVPSLEMYCNLEYNSLGSNPFLNYIITRGATTNLLINGEYLFHQETLQIPDGLTEIKPFSFAKVDNNKEVHIPASVKKIGQSAFYASVNKLGKVYIDGHIEEMGENAFGSCPYIGSIYLRDTAPAPIHERAFENNYMYDVANRPLSHDYMYQNCKLMVPKGSKEAYQNTTGWNLFQNIEEYEPTGVETTATEEPVIRESYTTDGRQVTTTTKGIIIHRMSDGSVRKVQH